MLAANQGLYDAMKAYNKEFGTNFGMDDAAGYTQDVTSRLNKTATDKNFLDIVIVVDQLLTGFDAPELNTLYVDRTLKGAGLIQAYSRTNRIADMQEKPWGRIVNYRWPAQNEKLMNEALAVYANKNSAILSEDERRKSNQKDGIIAKPFEDIFNEVKEAVQKLDGLTDEFQQLPPSEKQKEDMFDLLRDYNAGVAKLKQYTPEEVDGNTVGFNYDNPDELVEKLGMTSAQETMLTTVLTNELKQYMAKKKKIPFYQIELKMTHVKDVKIDYDYLTELVEQLLNQVHEGKSQEAQATKEKIDQFATGLEDRNYAVKVMNAAIAIIKGHFPPEGYNLKYPVKLRDSEQIIQAANNVSLDRMFLDFRVKWGITDIITSAQMRELFSHHRYDMQDLDDTGQIRDIIAKASRDYKTLAHDEKIQSLSKIRYRNGLRKAIYELADEHAES
jgi:type I restriction enzyme R subunit